MEEQHHTDDQSHYEISLTAGQAFVAFVLLLLSLAASFAFGLMIGKGQADERLAVRTEHATPPAPAPAPVTTSAPAPAQAEASAHSEPAPQQPSNPATQQPAPAQPAQPVYAQLLSTLDQKTADTLAAKLIDNGFTSAYVERGMSDKGTMFKVRVKFPSEGEAKAAEA